MIQNKIFDCIFTHTFFTVPFEFVLLASHIFFLASEVMALLCSHHKIVSLCDFFLHSWSYFIIQSNFIRIMTNVKISIALIVFSLHLGPVIIRYSIPQYRIQHGEENEHDDILKWKHFPRYWPLCGEFTGHRWIPRTKASDAELWCFLWSAALKTVE